MATAALREHSETQKSTKSKQALKKAVEKPEAELKAEQLASLEQGLTEVILISRGEMKGTPLSELWND